MTGFERSVAFWLRAYPRRWRVVRSAEVTAVLADLAGPGARRLDASAAFELVRGGWAARRREHPPLGVYLQYRILERRVPARYRAWARDDIDGSLYSVRQALWRIGVGTFVVLALLKSGLPVGRVSDVWFLWFMSLEVLAVSLVFPRTWRVRAVRKNLELRPGDAVAVGELVEGWAPRRRLNARSALDAALVLVSAAATAWTCAALIAPKAIGGVPCGPSTDDGSPWCIDVVVRQIGGATDRSTLVLVVAVLAALGGLASGRVVQRRLRRLVPELPQQPHRELVGSSASTVVAVAFWSALVLAEAGLEATGRLAILAAAVLGPGALLVLPGVAVARRFVRVTPDAVGLSGSDVLGITVRGRVPQIDQLRPGFVPVTGPVPEGTVMPALTVVPPPVRSRGPRDPGSTTRRDPFLRPEGDR
jgi:hypothetical protein